MTRKQEYRDFVLRISGLFLWRQLLEMNVGCSGASQEDITADGGFIVFLDIVYSCTGIRKYLDFASEAAEPGMTVGGEPSPPE